MILAQIFKAEAGGSANTTLGQSGNTTQITNTVNGTLDQVQGGGGSPSGNGASGGGSINTLVAPGTGISGQGFAGGPRVGNDLGGGGGAGEAGGTDAVRDGGDGIQIDWLVNEPVYRGNGIGYFPNMQTTYIDQVYFSGGGTGASSLGIGFTGNPGQGNGPAGTGGGGNPSSTINYPAGRAYGGMVILSIPFFSRQLTS